MHNMEKCGWGKGRPQGCSLRSHRRRRLAPLPPPFSPAPMLRHVVYASLLHFGGRKVRFKTKPQIALDQIRAAHAEGVAPGIVLADAGYGANSDFRAGVSALNLPYVVGIQSTPSVWPPGQAPLPPKPWSGRGRRPCNVQRDDEHKPVSVKDLALSLGKKAWRSVTWREGSNAPLASRFATVRVHLAARDYKRTTPHPVEWLLVEWPKGEAAPTKYWLSTLPEDTPLATLVDYAKLRWRIERDYEELKGELGLSHYEGRGWRGFHHHATLCIAAYGFSDLGTGRDSPLSLPAAHDASPTRRLSTPRRRRSVPNATSKTRSRRSENASPSRSQNPSRDVHAVSRRPDDLQPDCVYDTVKLANLSLSLYNGGGRRPMARTRIAAIRATIIRMVSIGIERSP